MRQNQCERIREQIPRPWNDRDRQTEDSTLHWENCLFQSTTYERDKSFKAVMVNI